VALTGGNAMIYSCDRILTTYAGSSPRPPELREPGIEGKRPTLRSGKFDHERFGVFTLRKRGCSQTQIAIFAIADADPLAG